MPRVDWTVTQGEDASETITLIDAGSAVNLTGASAFFQVRNKYADEAGSTAFVTLDETDGITLGGTAGTVQWQLTDTQTRDIPVGTHLYGLKVTIGTETRVIDGKFTVRPEVAREDV
jgi:hypothetical protein